jgi:peptide deformylase
MIETMHEEKGVGIAANQVGAKLRIAYIEMPEETDEEGNKTGGGEKYVLINPQVVRRVGERQVDEGCLSVPGFRGNLMRSTRVTVKALGRDGKEYRIRAEGLLAQVLEHEIDHLNGTIYLDRMEQVEELWPLTRATLADEADETEAPEVAPDARDDGPDAGIVWRMRKPASPVVRRG